VGFVWVAAAVLSQFDLRKGLMLTTALCIGYFSVAWVRVPVWKDELALFGQALQLEPENTSIRMRLATELSRRGRVDDALVQLEDVAKHEPKNLKALTSTAALHLVKKDWQGIETTCTKVFAIDAESAVCHLDMGIAALQQGRPEDAWARFDHAYQRNPRMWQALLQQGKMAFDAGDIPNAIRKLQGAAALNQNPQVLTLLGAAYGRAGETSQAVIVLNQALRLDPAFAPARQVLAQFHQTKPQ
jgi:Flp pilus assembly protein TadD